MAPDPEGREARSAGVLLVQPKLTDGDNANVRMIKLCIIIFLLGQVGIGFTAIADAAIINTWRDRQGSVWTWNDDTLEAGCDAMIVGQADDCCDLDDLSSDDFAAFAQGMLDAATACGWAGRAL